MNPGLYIRHGKGEEGGLAIEFGAVLGAGGFGEGEPGVGDVADAFERGLHFVLFGSHDGGVGVGGDVDGRGQEQDDAGEGFGKQEMVPGAEESFAAFDAGVQRDDGAAGAAGEQDRAGFGDVAGAAGAVDGEGAIAVHASGLGSTAKSAHIRTEVMNYFASEKIQRRELPGKWVALVGNTHVNIYKGVPGIAEQTGTVAVVVQDRIDRTDQPALRTRVTDFSPGMHLDMVVTMAWD